MDKLLGNIWNWLVWLMDLVLRKICHLPISDEKWNGFLQFVQFGIVGLSNTLISYVVYAVGIAAHLHYLAASVLGFLVSVANAFYWNNKYVFSAKEGEHRSIWKAFIKTFLSYAGTGLVLANVLLVLWVDVLGIHEMMAPILNLLVTIPLNFLLNKLWAFRTK